MRTEDGATPLTIAGQDGHDAVVSAVLEAGARSVEWRKDAGFYFFSPENRFYLPELAPYRLAVHDWNCDRAPSASSALRSVFFVFFFRIDISQHK